MSAKEIGDIKVNDGKGLFDSDGLLDTLLENLNLLPKLLIDNQFIAFCNHVNQMGQKILLLKKGIKADLESKDKMIASLNEELEKAVLKVYDMSPQEFKTETKGDMTNGED